MKKRKNSIRWQSVWLIVGAGLNAYGLYGVAIGSSFKFGALCAYLIAGAGLLMFLSQLLLLLLSARPEVLPLLIKEEWQQWRQHSPQEKLLEGSYTAYRQQLEEDRELAERLLGEAVVLEEIRIQEFEYWAGSTANTNAANTNAVNANVANAYSLASRQKFAALKYFQRKAGASIP